MAVVNIVDITADVWIPPAWLANWKVTITRLDGTVDDITTLIKSMRIVDAVTDGIGTFEVEFLNSDEAFTGLYTGMEDFTYYCDYDATPVTKRFHGKVEQPSYQGNEVRLAGRRADLFLADAIVTASFQSTDASEILTTLVTLKGGGRFTTSGVVASTGVALTVAWSQKPFMEIVKDLCTATGNDYYVNAYDDVQFFAANSRANPSEAIVHDFNLIEIGQFFPDVSQVKNRVRVSGADVNGVQVVYTAQNTASQALYGIKEVNVQDNNLTDLTSAQQYGDYLLADGLDPPIVGEAKGILLATVAPGDSIQISSPADGIFPAYQNVVKLVHEIGEQGIFTTATINKNPRQLSQILRKRVEAENQQQSTASNVFNLDFSYPFNFSTVSGSFAGTAADSGVLYLTGSPGGTWVSPQVTLASNLYAASVAIDGQTKTGITVEVSGNGGIDYETLTEGNLLLVGTSAGTALCFRVTLNDTASQVKGVAIYYSVS